MARLIDHLIVAVGQDRHEEIAARLAESGFVRASERLVEPGVMANEAVAFGGGAFIELLRPLQEPGQPQVWFGDTPRIQGVGFTTGDPQDYDDLADPWASIKDSWNKEIGGPRANGEIFRCRAAGPVPHLSEFYPFIMDRPEPEYGHLNASPVLRRITFAGQQHQRWQHDMAQWFRLAEHPEGLVTDDHAVLTFVPGPHPNIRLSFSFDVTANPGVIEISGGAIELNQR